MNPLYIIGGILILLTGSFLLAYILMKDKKEAIGFDRNMDDKVIIKRLLKYAKPHTWQFVKVLMIMALTVLGSIVMPLIIGKITDLLDSGEATTGKIVTLVLIYMAIILLSQVFAYIQAIILQRTGQKVVSTMREEVFTHIEALSHNDLHKIPVGKLVTRVANDTGSVSQMFSSLIVNLIRNVFMIVGIVIAMFIKNVKLTLAVLCFVPFIVFFTVIFRKFSRKAYREVRNATTDINTFLSENLSGIKVTQVFNQEDKKSKEFNQKNEMLGKAKTKQIFVFSVFRPSIFLIYISALIVLFWFCANDSLNHVVFAGQIIDDAILVIFYQYVGEFFQPIQGLADQFNWLQSALASAEKIFTILDMPIEIKDEPDAIELENIKGEIEFKDVWFAYHDEHWILKGVSFHINPKETVAFVGSTGAGKSTILSLIVRNYDIQKGQILIDGIDIKKIKISSLRSHFGQMLQDVFIFSGTIRSNILLRLEGIDDKEIMDVCHYVNADSFINKLDKGLDYEVKERGNNFSAGQRQLISFARTIIHRPSVMILDEATANIDTETEVLIQDSLERIKNIGTMIIVAHRLSTIQHSDKIIVLSHGQILESGSHQELLKLKGAYYKLYTLQYDKEQLMKS